MASIVEVLGHLALLKLVEEVQCSGHGDLSFFMLGKTSHRLQGGRYHTRRLVREGSEQITATALLPQLRLVSTEMVNQGHSLQPNLRRGVRCEGQGSLQQRLSEAWRVDGWGGKAGGGHKTHLELGHVGGGKVSEDRVCQKK